MDMGLPTESLSGSWERTRSARGAPAHTQPAAASSSAPALDGWTRVIGDSCQDTHRTGVLALSACGWAHGHPTGALPVWRRRRPVRAGQAA
ncbi:hypothetical protein OG753_39435 [Streptomyces sp. NBC_00029]|uniref:hypothetical protein n=1 Tax=Streptomyces sp. NBC_00029 TaxID=2903613 RepID=UPI0032515629